MVNAIDEFDPPLLGKLNHAPRFLPSPQIILQLVLVISSSKDMMNKDDQANVIPPKDNELLPIKMYHRVVLGQAED